MASNPTTAPIEPNKIASHELVTIPSATKKSPKKINKAFPKPAIDETPNTEESAIGLLNIV